MLLLFWSLLALSGTALTQDAAPADPTPDPACLAPDPDDPEKEIFMDCTEEQYAAEGKTDCCAIGGSVGCCEKGAGMKGMIDMLVGIGVGTFLLACLVFLCMYCNKKTFPCLGVCQEKAELKYMEIEEKICCSGHVEKKREEREQEKRDAEVPHYETPKELKQQVTDDFWGMPM